ncbi:MAG: glycoside hydrolase family 3 protein [Fibrobacteres bacterium]|nr:glycoside hydrolase family 3 protein [Fibrobacterota bacterium]
MDAATEKRISDIIGRLTLEDKVGQLMTMNHTGCGFTTFEKKYINKFRCGGLRITPHIIADVYDGSDSFVYRKLAPYAGPVEIAKVMRRLQEMAMERNGIPLHLVTDQEGDLSIDVLRGGVHLFPSSMGIAATGDLDLAYRSALAIAKQLRAQGINWMHSPEVDVNVQPENPEVGMRAFSDDPQICAEFGIAMMRGFLDGGVMPTAKHFPGRGDSVTDAHDQLDVSKKSLEALKACELLPYREMIKNGSYFAVMTAHQGFSSLDPSNTPASLSFKMTTELLRQEMGFKGVITTDAIGMHGAIDFAGSVPKAVLMALQAGADLVLMKNPEHISEETFNLVMQAVKEKKLLEKDVDEKVKRILEAKFRLGLFNADALPVPEKAMKPINDDKIRVTCEEVFRKGAVITRDRDKLLPLAKDKKVLVVEQYISLYHEKGNDVHYHSGMFSEFMREFGNTENIISLETMTPPTAEDERRLFDRIGKVDIVVFSDIFWRGSGSNRDLIRKTIAAGKKVIVATNDLYDSHFIPTAGTVICTFGAVPIGQKTAAQIICGKIKAEGKWPLRLIKMDEPVAADKVVTHKIAGHFATEKSPGK